jgi:hypothetical protein
MTDKELSDQVEACISALPKTLDTAGVVSLLCTIASAYSPEEDGPTNMAPIQGIEYLRQALGMMMEIREIALEKQTSILQ